MQRVETSPYASDLCSTSRRAPEFDLISWVLDLAGITQRLTQSILDVGCGNGSYECTGEEKASRSTGSGTSETILEASSEQRAASSEQRAASSILMLGGGAELLRLRRSSLPYTLKPGSLWSAVRRTI